MASIFGKKQGGDGATSGGVTMMVRSALQPKKTPCLVTTHLRCCGAVLLLASTI